MYSLLATSVTVGFNLTSSPIFWIFVICLLAVFVLFIFTLVRQYIFTKNCNNIQHNLKIGDMVRTFDGVYGKVVNISDSSDGKIVTLQSGTGKNIGFLSVDIKAIYCLDENSPNDANTKKSKKLSK